ncbi:hypothetical protein SeMB42_g08014 [Synchytrium endobioticum]|uniref:Reverse transcriptase domain-containing protein n=1 Tax=Synchytrium endobioticum TaxID=286115 RepID=A0A507BS56_9FUNG|nr:hypothetical protein SeMB42_g08014 [Synchytrium endobioticum]
MSCLVFSTKTVDIILGLDWLSYHNPSIEWDLRSVTFDGYACQHPIDPHLVPVVVNSKTGIRTDQILVNTPIQASIPPPGWSAEELASLPLPTWPKDQFPDLFDQEKQDKLPSHRPGFDFDPVLKSDLPLPKHRPLFRLSPFQRKLTDEYIDQELASGKIVPSKSPIASNLFFVPKGDDPKELRPCVDYRELNNCTVDDRYPMPNITALIQQLAGGDYYAKVDWRKAYNQIRVKEGSEWKLAFQCHRGLFQPTVMPFGPKTAPSHMQRFVTWMCQDFLAEGWLINLLDDFIIKTTGTVADHITHITRYLTRLMQNHIYIKESKCQWFVKCNNSSLVMTVTTGVGNVMLDNVFNCGLS